MASSLNEEGGGTAARGAVGVRRKISTTAALSAAVKSIRLPTVRRAGIHLVDDSHYGGDGFLQHQLWKL